VGVQPVNAPALQGGNNYRVHITRKRDERAFLCRQKTVNYDVRGKIGAFKDFFKVLTNGHGKIVA
jgi:hypothetical protein